MSKPYRDFEPNWFRGDYSPKSYRSIFKWGGPDQIKPPKETLYKMIKETFGLTDADFDHYTEDLGLDEVQFDAPIALSEAQLDALRAIVGPEYLRTDDYARLSVAYGKTMYDILRLRGKIVENIPDAVLYPDTKDQIEQIVAYCQQEKIPVYVYGGGSSVTRGVECMKGGVSLDMRLRFNKVVICTDADVDGYQIRTLVLTMIYRLVPTLIQEGYVYIAESPLYEINTRSKTYFAYTEPEKANIMSRIDGKEKYTIQRSKGLGENEPDMMWLTTMNPETRRLIRVMPEDVERTAAVFDLLLGDNLQGRKDHIAENGYKYLEMADIS